MSANDSSHQSCFDGPGGYRNEHDKLKKSMENSKTYRTGENPYRPIQDSPARNPAPTAPSASDRENSETFQQYRPNSEAATRGQSQNKSGGEWAIISEAKGEVEGSPSSGRATAGSKDLDNDDDVAPGPSETNEISSVVAEDGYDEDGRSDAGNRASQRKVTTIRVKVRPKPRAKKTETEGEKQLDM